LVQQTSKIKGLLHAEKDTSIVSNYFTLIIKQQDRQTDRQIDHPPCSSDEASCSSSVCEKISDVQSTYHLIYPHLCECVCVFGHWELDFFFSLSLYSLRPH